MLALSIILGVACVLLLAMLSFQDNKNTKLSVENGLMKGRIETLQERLAERASVSPEGPLTVEGVEEAIRHAGYVPDVEENWIRFMVSGEPFYVETGRLPSVFVLRQYGVDTKDWEMDLLKQAAHQMSDELMMVKAIFDEDKEETGLRFLVAALDANNSSFKQNLTRYVGLIDDGRRKMNEFYEGLVKEKREAAMTFNPFAPEGKSESKLLS
jgi:hypothetical protein